MEEMTSMERVTKTLRHEEPDRVPVFLIALTIGAREAGVTVHEYATDAKVMAKGQLNYLEKYKVDGLVPMSDVAAYASAFGTTTKFFDTIEDTPVFDEFAVKKSEEWKDIEVIDPFKDGRIPVMLEACKIIKDRVGDSVPVVGLTPSPITYATWLMNMADVMKDVIRHPDLLKIGLETLADSSIEIGRAFIASGADAILVNVTRCTKDILTQKWYELFGMPYDLKVLNAFKDKVPLMLHVCGVHPMLDLLIEHYPIQAVNWWDRGTSFSLSDVKHKKVALIGGLDQTREMLSGSPGEVEAQAKDAIKQAAKGGGFLLSCGCELSAITPPENIHAAVNAAKKYGKYPIEI